jgi:hypothetical protein
LPLAARSGTEGWGEQRGGELGRRDRWPRRRSSSAWCTELGRRGDHRAVASARFRSVGSARRTRLMSTRGAQGVRRRGGGIGELEFWPTRTVRRGRARPRARRRALRQRRSAASRGGDSAAAIGEFEVLADAGHAARSELRARPGARRRRAGGGDQRPTTASIAPKQVRRSRWRRLGRRGRRQRKPTRRSPGDGVRARPSRRGMDSPAPTNVAGNSDIPGARVGGLCTSGATLQSGFCTRSSYATAPYRSSSSTVFDQGAIFVTAC